MSKENKDHLVDDVERIFHGKSRRVGTKERTLVGEYVNEAYAGGYLSDEELRTRQDKIAVAKYNHDLQLATDDLPSYAELTGRKNVPVKNAEESVLAEQLLQQVPGAVSRDHVRAGLDHRDRPCGQYRVTVPR